MRRKDRVGGEKEQIVDDAAGPETKAAGRRVASDCICGKRKGESQVEGKGKKERRLSSAFPHRTPTPGPSPLLSLAHLHSTTVWLDCSRLSTSTHTAHITPLHSLPPALSSATPLANSPIWQTIPHAKLLPMTRPLLSSAPRSRQSPPPPFTLSLARSLAHSPADVPHFILSILGDPATTGSTVSSLTSPQAMTTR